MAFTELERDWVKPILWLTSSLLAAFFLQFDLFMPQYMALAVGTLVFLESNCPPLKIIFCFAFLCDVIFHRPFGFYALIFLGLIWLASRFRYRFFLANPLVQSLSVLVVTVIIETYEMGMLFLMNRTVSWDVFIVACLSSGLLWPVYAKLLAGLYGKPAHRTVIG